jgi:hypothetical protein
MAALLNNTFSPITSSIGLVKAALDKTSDAFFKWEFKILSKYNQSIIYKRVDCGLSQALSLLPPLTSPTATRYLLLSLGDEWTAFFDNGHMGTDPLSFVAVMSSELQTIGLTVKSRPVTLTRGAATMLEVFDRSLRSRRSISCVNDGGHWSFEQHGTPYPFEDLASYKSKVKAKRFGPELLDKYKKEFGVEPFSDFAFVDQHGCVRGVFAEKTGELPPLTYVELSQGTHAVLDSETSGVPARSEETTLGMSPLDRIAERISRLGRGDDGRVARPLLTLSEFFDGNDDFGSIGCNLDPPPGPAVFYSLLKRIAARPDVADVRVQVTDFDSGEWPFSDTVWVITSAEPEEVARWFPEELRPDDCRRGWTEEVPLEPCPVPPAMHPVAAWWD